MPKNFETIGLVAAHDVSAADWIESGLEGCTGKVSRLVPAMFQAYARLFHPAITPEGESKRWGEVAAELGGTMHPLAQWHSLVGLASPSELPGSVWPGSPELGSLPADVMGPVCDVLARHTSNPDKCFFGFWTGRTVTSTVAGQAESPAVSRGGRQEHEEAKGASGPEFSLPPNAGREYALWVGPIRAAVAVAELDSPFPGSPNLFWPSDRAWFLVTDIDLDSTLIGGSNSLIDELLAADVLEICRLSSSDSIAFDADRLNRAGQ